MRQCHLPLEMALSRPAGRIQVSCVLFPQLVALTFPLPRKAYRLAQASWGEHC